MNLIKKTILACSLVVIANSALAWQKEVSKAFNGDTLTFLVKKSKDGSELVVDYQQGFIYYSNQKRIGDYVDGIKLDGQYVAARGRFASENNFRVAIFCRKGDECWDRIHAAKKVDVNVRFYPDNGFTVISFN